MAPTPQQSAPESRPQKKQTSSTMIPLIAAGVLVVLVALGFILGGSADVAKDGKIDDTEAAQILTEMQTLIQLPQEKPVMALVTNADTLIKEQTFYQGVSNGDVLVIFPQARKAVLYSLKKKMLINVGPVNLGETAKEVTPKDQTTLTPASTPTATPPKK